MKPDPLTVQGLFETTRQYAVPYYQRTYTWGQDDQWEPLWEDISAKAESRLANPNGRRTPHYLGAIVLEPQQQVIVGVNVVHIIDGQQRLTTLQYVLRALYLVISEYQLEQLARVLEGYVKNVNRTAINHEDQLFKLWPTFRDRPTFRMAMSAESFDALRERFPDYFTQQGKLRKYADHPPSLSAIWYFGTVFREWLGQAGLETEARATALIHAVLQDLKVIAMSLEDDDDPQVIFETLNARGVELRATDLIRNYIFLRAERDHEDASNLFDTHWARFEAETWTTLQTRGRLSKPRLEWFVHACLQAELHEEVDLGRLYNEYRRFTEKGPAPLKASQQLEKLTNYSDHYLALIQGTGTLPIAQFGRRISDYDITTLYPLALSISVSTATDDEKRKMFGYLNSYVVRRAICGLPTKNYNNVFMGVLKQLHQVGMGAQSLRSTLKALTGDSGRWPDEGEFHKAATSAPLYPVRLDAPKMRSILKELEAYLRAGTRVEEPVVPNLEALDIDHVMPQTWFAHWPLPDGLPATKEERDAVNVLLIAGEKLSDKQSLINAREERIQRLGNLTLLNLSVNREAQHREFPVKRQLLVENTALRLNVPLVTLQQWREQEIDQRGETLAGAVSAIWPGPVDPPVTKP